MKFANFSNIGGAYVDEKKSSINIGDYMQLYAIDELYRRMGINNKDVYYIDIRDVQGYKGEKLILPINFMISDMTFCRNGKFIFSDDIVPVFIGICIYRDGFTFSEYNIEYLKRYSPIGCRDYITQKLLRSYGIEAYLAGCISFTLPYREKLESQKKVYFVDVPEFVREYIPREITKSDIEIRHHIIELGKEDFNDGLHAKKYALNLKNEYERFAKLVVTSRLHCASPCIAMGIPTVLVREYSGYTFEWIKQFVRIYNPSDAKDIEWNGISYSQHVKNAKESMINVACHYIRKAYEDRIYFRIEDCYPTYRNIEMGYDNTQKVKEDKLERIMNEVTQNNVREYCIWGVSEDAEKIYTYMSEKCPKAKLVKVIDTYRDLIFHGIKSEKPDIIEEHNDFFTIVTSVNAVNAAKDLFTRIGKPKAEYTFIADTFIDDLEVTNYEMD